MLVSSSLFRESRLLSVKAAPESGESVTSVDATKEEIHLEDLLSSEQGKDLEDVMGKIVEEMKEEEGKTEQSIAVLREELVELGMNEDVVERMTARVEGMGKEEIMALLEKSGVEVSEEALSFVEGKGEGKVKEGSVETVEGGGVVEWVEGLELGGVGAEVKEGEKKVVLSYGGERKEVVLVRAWGIEEVVKKFVLIEARKLQLGVKMKELLGEKGKEWEGVGITVVGQYSVEVVVGGKRERVSVLGGRGGNWKVVEYIITRKVGEMREEREGREEGREEEEKGPEIGVLEKISDTEWRLLVKADKGVECLYPRYPGWMKFKSNTVGAMEGKFRRKNEGEYGYITFKDVLPKIKYNGEEIPLITKKEREEQKKREEERRRKEEQESKKMTDTLQKLRSLTQSTQTPETQKKIRELKEVLRKKRRELFSAGKEVYFLMPSSVKTGSEHKEMALERGVIRYDAETKTWSIENTQERWSIRLDSIPKQSADGTILRMMWSPEEFRNNAYAWTREFSGIQPESPQQKMLARKYEMLNRNAKLSRAEFLQLFDVNNDQKVDWRLIQQNVDNCYMLAAIRALSPDVFEGLVRMSIDTVQGGWNVYIPMGKKDAKPIFVKTSDLGSQLHNGVYYRPVNGAKGFQILEAAYSIYRGKYSTQTKAKGGRDSKGQIHRQATGWGWGDRVLKDMIHGSEKINISMWGDKEDSRVTQLLNSFYNGRDMLTVASNLHSSTYYLVGSHQLMRQHEYVITSVDPKKKIVVIRNPHDTAKPMNFTYKEFFKAFRNVQGIKIDYEDLFN